MVEEIIGEKYSIIDFEEAINKEIDLIQKEGCYIYDIKYQALLVNVTGQTHYAMILYGYGESE